MLTLIQFANKTVAVEVTIKVMIMLRKSIVKMKRMVKVGNSSVFMCNL